MVSGVRGHVVVAHNPLISYLEVLGALRARPKVIRTDRKRFNTLSNGFDALGVRSDIVAGLTKAGLTEPTAIQALTIGDALSGRDVCGKAGTGSGKTLAFGIPILQLATRAKPGFPTALVLAPTRELAVQVKEVLSQIAQGQTRVDAFYGGVSIDRQMKSLRRGVDIVVATPGRLIDLIDRRCLSLSDTILVVLDEADRMADMGFLPPVERILGDTHPDRQTMLFSATLDGDVDRLIRRNMKDPVTHEVQSAQPTVDTMTHHFFLTDPHERLDMIAKMSAGAERTLVFVRTRDSADRLATRLQDSGIDAEAFYGGIRQSARERALQRFSTGRTSVLVATDVAARGLDVTGLDLVIHFDLPEDSKAYLHRSGRTARAGATGVVVSFLLRSQIREVIRMQRQIGLDVPVMKPDLEHPALAGIAQGEEIQATLVDTTSERRPPSVYATAKTFRGTARKSSGFSGARGGSSRGRSGAAGGGRGR